ncbi:MAG: VWA domain-containing protein [Ardenticatenales bacterium]
MTIAPRPNPSRRRLAVAIPFMSFMLLAATSASPARARPAAQTQPPGFTLAATWQSATVPLPPGVWRRALGVDIGADGRTYVVDGAERRVSFIDAADQPGLLADAAASGLVAPTHLAVDSDHDRIYVSDAGAGGVVVLDGGGRKVATWPVPSAAGVAALRDGTGVVVGSGDDGTVHVLNADGSERAAWPSQVTTERGDLVRGIDVDAGGRVHVLDGRHGTVRTFSLAGTRQDSLDLNLPIGVQANDIAFAGYGGSTSGQRFLATTSIGIVVIKAVTGEWNLIPRGELYGLAYDAARGIVATQPGRNDEGSTLFRWPPGTDRPATPERSFGELAARVGTFEQPTQVTRGADGLLLVLDRQWRVQRFRPDGTAVDQKARPWLSHAPAAAVDGPTGTLYVTNGGTIAAYDPAAGLLWQTAVGDGTGHAAALAVGPGPRYDIVAVDALGDELERFDAATGRSAGTVQLPPSAGDSALWGDLDVDAAGNAYALDRVNGTVAVVPLAAAGPTRTLALPPRVRRLAVAPDGGTLYALDRDGWVRRFDAAGAPDGAFDATRFDIATASLPSDVAVDAAGSVYVTDRAANVVSVWRPDSAAFPQTPPDGGGECRALPDKTASPDSVRLGDPVEVRLTVRGGCGTRASATPVDILLVLDRSGSMAGEKLRLLRDAAASFIADIDFGNGRVGVVSFNDTATLDAPLSSQAGPPRDAVRNLQATGTTLINIGLARARQELQQRGRPEARKVIVLFSDGIENRDDANKTRAEADQLKRTLGVEIFTVSIGGSSTLLRTVATDDAHAFVADDARFLYAIFEAIAERVGTSVLFKTITVTDHLPPNMRLVAGSIVPPATVAADAAQGDVLTWTLTDVPIAGLGLRYQVEPLECGEAPTNVAAFAAYTDGYGRDGRLDFPVPRVTVLCSPPTATPTATTAPSATPTVTSTPPPSPTPTATRPPAPIYLPIGLTERCKPGERHADVVLAIDASSSMAGDKIAAARAAARLFISLLDLPRDQVGLVAFDENARVIAPLGSAAAALNAAINALGTGSGTRIDLGLEAAQGELFGPRHAAGNSRLLVLLTDGRQPDETRTLALAADLRAKNVVLYAIGLGADVDLPFLTRITGDATRARIAPSTGDLAAIYRQVAGEVPCPPSAYWGGR